MNRPSEKEITDLQIRIVKSILDHNREVRAFARGYLATHHPEERIRISRRL